METFDLDAVKPAESFKVSIGGQEKEIELTPDAILQTAYIMTDIAQEKGLKEGETCRFDGETVDKILAILTGEQGKKEEDQFYMNLDSRRRVALGQKLISWYQDQISAETKKKESSAVSSDSTDAASQNSAQ